MDALTKKVADLNAIQEVNAKALAAAKAGDSKAVADLKQSLSASQSEVAGLKKNVSESQISTEDLKKQIAQLTANLSEGAKSLTQVKQQLSESQAQTAALTKQLATVNQSQDQNAKSAVQMKASLKESQDLAKDLLAKNADLIAEDKRKAEQIASVQQSLVESQKQREAAEKNWQDASGKLKEQEKQLAALRNQKPTAVDTPEPKSQNEVRSYALGTLWGQEVNGAMKKVKSDGIPLELSQVINGVSDSLKGQYRVPEQKIMDQLEAMNKQVLAKNQPAESSRGPDKFLQSFSQKPGTKRAEMGYYYRMLNRGEGKITDGDVVAISVKESLANGKVIKDMTKTGKVLALPLANFPPLFSSAIRQMNNKGKLRMAVPPELAYGVQGRPPEIPPNSIMVYDITVVDVRPGEGK